MRLFELNLYHLLENIDDDFWILDENNGPVVFSKIYAKTVDKYANLKPKLDLFIDFKSQNPSKPFGSKDTQFTPDSILGKHKIRHAHLSHDVAIFYLFLNSKLHMVGVFSHDDYMRKSDQARIAKIAVDGPYSS